ncbi:MAG: DUF2185 domain-containing protein [Thermotaleaceae bacterium]
MNTVKNIAKKISLYQRELNELSENREAKKVNREEFTLLLSGISTCRKAPGIPVHMGYETLYHCESKKDEEMVREHLWKVYGIQNTESLLEFCEREYSVHKQYEQFMTFWVKAPLFDIEELTSEGRKKFEECKKVSEQFYPILNEKGYYAWDINEKIGLYRKAVACGILSDKEFWQLTDPWVRLAQVFYHSYQEYAVSCLCGAVYFMYLGEPDLDNFFQINFNLVQHLFMEGGAWQRSQWYVPQNREWVDLLGSNPGCIITKAALERNQIGYMYREEPSKNFPDCGWRFFVGDESDEYVNQADNNCICSFNDACIIDPTILAYFYAGYGCRFDKINNRWVQEF